MQLEKFDELVKRMQIHPSMLSQGAGLLAYRNKCTKEDIYMAKEIVRGNIARSSIGKMPKILIFDIETAPLKAFVWNLWKENIPLDRIISDYFIICWSAKWLYAPEVMSDCLTPEEIFAEDDSRIIKRLHELIDAADVVVTHNGNRFDIPRINTRFIVNGLNPPAPYFSVDTCAVARKQFGFSSNKLDALAKYLGYSPKLETNFDLWRRCLEGDEEALNYMVKYNKRDVTLLEEVYIKLKPWIKGHPNYGVFLDSSEPSCSNCGSDKLERIPNKFYYTQFNKYPLFRCTDCGAVVRGRKGIKVDVSTTGNLH